MKNRNFLDGVKFDTAGLVPVIAVDHITGEVLMLAYANREALEKTLETGKAHYYSRSRAKLWKKGETSGNFQEVVAIRLDCDGDAVVYEVIPAGPSCHTGNRSCFFTQAIRWQDKGAPSYPFLQALYDILEERKRNLPEGSYTAKLFKGAPEKINEKILEEAEELAQALSSGSREDVVWEASDLLFFIIMGLVWRGIQVEEILKHLFNRHLKKKGGEKNE